MNKICPKCGNKYDAAPAMSRLDGSNICPECGSREALVAAVNAGALTKEAAEAIMAEILRK